MQGDIKTKEHESTDLFCWILSRHCSVLWFRSCILRALCRVYRFAALSGTKHMASVVEGRNAVCVLPHKATTYTVYGSYTDLY